MEEKLESKLEDTTKKVHSKRENNKNLKIILISIVAVIILLVASFSIIMHYKKLNVLVFDNYKLYQYFSGVKTSYSGKISLSRDGSITKISSNNGVENIEDAPIYYEDKSSEALISKNMQLVIPRLKNKNYKLKYFTNIIYEDESKLAYYYNGKDKVYLENSFLYDGEDLYLFLYDTIVTIDNNKYELSPLSYIIVNYKEQIEIYNKKNDEYKVIDTHNNDVVTTIGDAKINLSTDMIMYEEESRLLIKSTSNLPVYTKGE